MAGGYGNGLFGPEDTITRQDLAVILLRYAEYKGLTLPAIRGFQRR
ncbi:MAG: S-layer homology domain-containing protein [Oscillospiraceae bacterium]|nr:S-layer homology domain-containing protein [Oscillospiraceae bacterium]